MVCKSPTWWVIHLIGPFLCSAGHNWITTVDVEIRLFVTESTAGEIGAKMKKRSQIIVTGLKRCFLPKNVCVFFIWKCTQNWRAKKKRVNNWVVENFAGKLSETQLANNKKLGRRNSSLITSNMQANSLLLQKKVLIFISRIFLERQNC